MSGLLPHANVYVAVVAARPHVHVKTMSRKKLARQPLELSPVDFVDRVKILAQIIKVSLVEKLAVLSGKRFALKQAG